MRGDNARLRAKLDAVLILCLCAALAIWAGADGSAAGWITVAISIVLAIGTVLTLVERLRP